MIKGNTKQVLTKESILLKLSEYDIFRMYLVDKNWKVNQAFLSPFRKESNPSFEISNRSGSLYFIDYTDTSLRGDCFKFIQCLFGCDFDTTLKMIDRDFGLGISSNENLGVFKKIVSEYKQPEEAGKRYALIQATTRKFTSEELAYWNEYHQDISDLKSENIYSIKKLYLNKRLFPLKETELRFGYFYDGHWKIYRPFADSKNKWMPNNVPITAMDGCSNLIEDYPAFINKSKKDYMVIKKVYPFTCAVQNEGIACFSEENVSFLKENSSSQILSFDSDVAGVKNSQQITQIFDFGYCNVPRSYLSDGIKDWALLAKEYGMKKVEQILTKKKINK